MLALFLLTLGAQGRGDWAGPIRSDNIMSIICCRYFDESSVVWFLKDGCNALYKTASCETK